MTAEDTERKLQQRVELIRQCGKLEGMATAAKCDLKRESPAEAKEHLEELEQFAGDVLMLLKASGMATEAEA